jgi:hypothetical protein
MTKDSGDLSITFAAGVSHFVVKELSGTVP